MAKINRDAVHRVIEHAYGVKRARTAGEALRESRAAKEAASTIYRDSKTGRFVDDKPSRNPKNDRERVER